MNSGPAFTSQPMIDAASLAAIIDYTLLKPYATVDDVTRLCREAKECDFGAVCVNGSYVPLAVRLLADSNIKVCTVIGFPLGAVSSLTKAVEARDAIAAGAREVDMVINIGRLKSGDLGYVKRDIQGVVDVADGRAVVKVIIETGLLTKEEKVEACTIAKEVGAGYVKTCTGFSGGRATVEDVALMREVVGPDIGVKASGGIADLATAIAMIEAGATRIGTSSGVAIMNEARRQYSHLR